MTRVRKPIPDNDHVVRYVPISRQARDLNGNLMGNGVLYTALQQRKDESYVSVNWLEFHQGTRTDRLALIRQELSEAFPPKSLGKALLAIGHVGQIKRACSDAGRPVRVTHEPTRTSPSHAGIRQFPTEEDGLLEALAAEVFIDTMLASDV